MMASETLTMLTNMFIKIISYYESFWSDDWSN